MALLCNIASTTPCTHIKQDYFANVTEKYRYYMPVHNLIQAKTTCKKQQQLHYWYFNSVRNSRCDPYFKGMLSDILHTLLHSCSCLYNRILKKKGKKKTKYKNYSVVNWKLLSEAEVAGTS
jgi:hypothetical protein